VDYLGTHLLVELYGCEADRAGDEKYIERVMKEAATDANAKVMGSLFHKFGETGVAGVIILTEGFYVIRSWGKEGYIGLDLYSSSETVDNEKALAFLVRKFGATKYSASEIKRGNKAEILGGQ
jgi:S-adenosylmethionine decarboxylase